MLPPPPTRGRPATHRHSHSPTYIAWKAMKQAVTNPRARGYANVGGRGIGMDTRWHHFDGFLASMGEKPEDAKLQRMDTEKDFTPENCFWGQR